MDETHPGITGYVDRLLLIGDMTLDKKTPDPKRASFRF
jgi:hypothetical protein